MHGNQAPEPKTRSCQLSRRVATSIAPFFLCAASVAGQTTVTIDDRVSCRECAVSFSLAARLGSSNDPTGVAVLAEVAVDSRGRYAVASDVTPGEILIYDSSGRFVRTIGRRGSGPGEFQTLTKLQFGPGDSLHVLATRTARYTVFGPSLEHVRSVGLAGRAYSFAVGPSGQVVADVHSVAQSSTFGFRVFSASGEPLTAFEAISNADAAAHGRSRRHVAIGPDGGIWTARPDHYEIRSYDAQGRLRATYQASRDWLASAPRPERLEITAKPQGQISAVFVDQGGLVWVFGVVADVNWRPPSEDVPPNPSAMYDTVIEVFEPRSGAIVARGRVDHIVYPLRSGQVYGVVQQPSGDHQVQVWNATLPARP
jgi:hypothetical protein